MQTVIREPENEQVELPRCTTVRQMLNRLKVRQTEVLVIRDGVLLTPDRKLGPADTIHIRYIVSRG